MFLSIDFYFPSRYSKYINISSNAEALFSEIKAPQKRLIPQGGNFMNSLKRITAAALSAALCFSMAVPAYADHYQTPKSIKGVLINEHAQIPDVLEVGASQVVLNFPMSWAFSSQLSV